MANAVKSNLRDRISQLLNNPDMPPGRAGLYERVLEYIESHQFAPGSFLAWFRDSGFGFGNGRTPRFENQHNASPLNESTAAINGVSTIDQAAPKALQVPNLDDAMDSSHTFDSTSGALDFNFDFWQQRPKVEIARPVIHAEQAQALQNLIQAMSSFMHR